MNWKNISFWTALFVGLSFFLFSFATFLFAQQEEMQLFIPEWNNVRQLLFCPGGFCRLAGLFFVQFYTHFIFSSIFNACLLAGIGYLTYQILQQISDRGYNFLLSLFPVFFLFHFHIQWAYVVDGTIGLLLMLTFLLLFFQIGKRPLTYGIASSILICLLTGQLVFIYGVFYALLSWISRKNRTVWLLFPVVIAMVLSYVDNRSYLSLPLSFGLYGESYHETQLQPDSYMYNVWIRFSVLLLIIFLISWLLVQMQWKGKIRKILIYSILSIFLFGFTGACLPNKGDVQNRMGDQLAYWSGQGNWDALIGMHYGKKVPYMLNRNYLNIALAHKGILANRLFFFDQYGPQGLLAPYNYTYRMSILLGEIHYFIGDISTSESYAMEALTLARRGGSPRALQLLVRLNLLKGEWNIAAKYLSILGRMPNYKDWASRYRLFLHHPERIAKDPEFSGKQVNDSIPDLLLSQVDLERLWTMHSKADTTYNRTAMEYLGCSYLLAKETGLFKAFYLRIKDDPAWKPMPVPFQEAALLLLDDDSSLSDEAIEETVRQRYEAYKKANRQALKMPSALAELYRQFGNTFWFYYQHKELTKK